MSNPAQGRTDNREKEPFLLGTEDGYIHQVSSDEGKDDASVCWDSRTAERKGPSCLTLCDPMDSSPPGSSVRGILQARVLEGAAMPSSKGASRPTDRTGVSYVSLHWQAGSLPLAPPGKREGSQVEAQSLHTRGHCVITSLVFWKHHPGGKR